LQDDQAAVAEPSYQSITLVRQMHMHGRRHSPRHPLARRHPSGPLEGLRVLTPPTPPLSPPPPSPSCTSTSTLLMPLLLLEYIRQLGVLLF
jgi:hypothetical protein